MLISRVSVQIKVNGDVIWAHRRIPRIVPIDKDGVTEVCLEERLHQSQYH